MKNSQKKAAGLCILAFLAGCLICFSGCAWGTATRIDAGQHQYETGAGIYLELECCACCGFAPWTDSWCEFHYGT